MAALKPVVSGVGVDFTGNEYNVEGLPETAQEGDTCEISFPGRSGWYQEWYVYLNGVWCKDGDTVPWQMKT